MGLWPSAMAVPRAALLLQADTNKSKLMGLLTCSEDDFAEFEKASVPPKKRKKVWDVLGLSDADVLSLKIPGGTVLTMRGLRSLFKEFPLRTDLPFLTNLLDGKACCTVCHATNKVEGIVKLDYNSMTQHASGAKHKLRAAAAETRRVSSRLPATQVTLLNMGLVPADVHRRKRDYATMLAAGAFVARNVAPHKIPLLMSQDMLRVIQTMKGGFPSASHISTACVPDLLALIDGRFKTLLRDKDVALAIDGGAAYGLMGKAKVVVVTASSLTNKTLVLEVVVLAAHETAEIQASIIEALCTKYGIDKERAIYV